MSAQLPFLVAQALSLLAGVLAAQGGASSFDYEVRTGYGAARFLVADPDARESAAARLNLDRAGKSGAVPAPTWGWTLHAAVLVETPEPQYLRDVALAHGALDVSAVAGAPAFRLVSADSVDHAIRLVTDLAPYFAPGAVYLDAAQPLGPRALPNDPMIGQQWHLSNGSPPEADANVEPAWDAGYRGSGVVVGVTEWGAENGHADLSANYNSAGSQNAGTSSHGTSVAGVMAAVANNNRGVAGAAYDAQWSEQLVGGSSQTANAFGYRNDVNDAKNNSWGPPDDGNLHFISSTELNALASATAAGRGGLGEIFCWAAGNGGTGDRVEYDPYAASRYTVAVGAIGDQDTRAWYNEKGASMLVVAQSSGNSRGITTTTSGGYTSNFGGTSSASPLGCGVVALMLDANPNLGWRDIQGALLHSARKCDPGNGLWLVNGAGHDINYHYGFGAADGAGASATAAAWSNYPAESTASSGRISVNQAIPDNNSTGLSSTTGIAQNIRIESVELIMNVTHTAVGDLEIRLIAPSGTISKVSAARGDTQNNLNDYRFTSLRHWDEWSAGDWKVEVKDLASGDTGTWNSYELHFFGNDGNGGPGLTLYSGVVTAGDPAEFHLRHGLPGANAWLGWSLTPGSTTIGSLGVTVDMANPRVGAGPTMTDAEGSLDWTVSVPSAAAGLTVLIQAVQSGAVSNLWTTRIN